jgi:hypothetical protein
MFERIKHWYESGMWDADRVDRAVLRGWITLEQAAEILTPPDESP